MVTADFHPDRWLSLGIENYARQGVKRHMGKHNRHYSDNSFWKKIKAVAASAGKGITEKVLTLYYCFCDRDTPAWAKTVIVGALGYFIIPLDAIPDITPVAGYTDDLGVIASAFAMVAVHIKQEHVDKTKEKLKIWF
jgi:uncharacterized membrane protein YkvA (DUF1232 family)